MSTISQNENIKKGNLAGTARNVLKISAGHPKNKPEGRYINRGIDFWSVYINDLNVVLECL